MPPPATLDELVDRARQAGAADTAALNRFRAGRGSDELGTAEAAARAMVRDGLLTPYQAERLLRGEAGALRIGDRYRVLDKAGGGGMGQVFLCEDTAAGRAVAVKVLPAALGRDPQAAARFRREARATAVLDHPAIVRARDVGTDGRHPYLVLEFIDGTDLYRYVAGRGPLGPRTAAHYVARAADALQRAADQGWVHRDVKPHNLMVDRAGRLRVLDLGLARPLADDSVNAPVTDPDGTHGLLGTADFIAPEQAVDSSRADCRADIYSLGATFYFLLTGRPPFPDGTTAQKLAAHRTREAVPVRDVRPDVPDGMAAVLARMLRKNPADRYPTPAAVAAALAVWSEPAPPAPDPGGLPDWPPAVRRLLDLPAGGGAGPGAAGPPPLPSSYPRTRGRSGGPDQRELPGWVAVGSMLVGLITALLLAFRNPPMTPGPAASAMPPSAGAWGPDQAPSAVDGPRIPATNAPGSQR